VLLVLYIAVAAVLPSLPARQTLALHFLHAVLWRCFHSFGLGMLLREQSKRKYIVRYFMSHYYYPEGYVRQGALEEAFTNWKSLYNMSVCMTYGTLLFIHLLHAR
jgi:phosphatidylethanolamine N-methyltransferase